MTTTFMEQAIEHGYVAAEITRLIKRDGFDAKLFQVYPVAYRDSGKRAMRVFYTPLVAETPLFEYTVPTREKLESKDLWQKRVTAELTELWAAHTPNRPQTEKPNTADAPLPASEKAALRAALAAPSEPAEVDPKPAPKKKAKN